MSRRGSAEGDSAGVGARGDTPARTLVVTMRRLNQQAAWCTIYEFEDVIRAVDDVELLELEPAGRFETRQRIARSLAWRGWHSSFGRMNPGVKPVTLGRDYDLLVFVCMNVWDLLYLNAIRDWARCKVKVCYIMELYGGLAEQHDHLLRLLEGFDAVAQPLHGSVDAISRTTGRPCHHVPLGVDVRRFTPYPDPPRRVIDVCSVGRRSEPVHQALLRFAGARRAFYVHDTIPGALVRPSRPQEHRDMLANTAKRSRFFVTYPAKFGDRENQGQSEVGARYFEGAAAGAVLLGQAPTAPAFREEFPWPDAVVDLRPDGGDVADVLTALEERPEELERASSRNAVAALRGYDWAHRWGGILAATGVSPCPGLATRLRALEALADAVDRTPPAPPRRP